MRHKLVLLFVLLWVGHSSFSQEKEATPPATPKALKTQGILLEEGSYTKVKIDPLSPAKAAFYSAIFPGLGQIYNKRYWKLPIVYGAIGTALLVYSNRNTEYNRARDAFKRRRAGFTDDDFFDLNGDGIGPDVSDAALQNAQENIQEERDLALIIAIALYALNIIDANVDAHLKQYNVNNDLSLDFKPYLNIDPLTQMPNYGMTLILQF